MNFSSKIDNLEIKDAVKLFSDYLRVTGVTHTDPEQEGDPRLIGKRLGLLNGSSWITLWSNYFGRKYLPGVQLINTGNDAVQINFMQSHQSGHPVPPQSNIDSFTRYAQDLVNLAQVDAVLITCSTMNRAYPAVGKALDPFNVPVFQIDMPMMESAVNFGGKILVVATHGPTVKSTHALLRETAEKLGKTINYAGLTVENAWHDLARGDIEGHNQRLASGIRQQIDREKPNCVVLAQLSMTALLLSYPDPVKVFGVPVFTSGQYGFEFVRDYFINESGETSKH